MKTILKIALVVSVLGLMVPEADGVLGVRRRTACRTAVVVGSSVHAADMAAASSSAQQQTAAAQQQTAQAQQQTAQAQQQTAEAQKTAAAKEPAAAATPAPTPATGAGKLPLGTVVPGLPPGCVSTPVNGVEYYYGNGNFYRAVFQGNSLVYVTADPK